MFTRKRQVFSVSQSASDKPAHLFFSQPDDEDKFSGSGLWHLVDWQGVSNDLLHAAKVVR